MMINDLRDQLKMNKLPIEIAVGQTNILIEDEVCKAVGKVGIHINKKELLKALKAYEFVEELTNYIFAYPDDDYMTMECLCRKLFKYGLIDKKDGYYLVADGIKADRKTEPTISKMEQVDKDINVRSKDEPQTESFFRNPTAEEAESVHRYIESISKPTGVNIFDLMDEPQTERSEL